jgi:hypothetical protein
MDFYLQFKKNHRRILNPKFVVNDLVDLVPFYCFDHNMQQSGTAATQYIVVFCFSLILNQQSLILSHRLNFSLVKQSRPSRQPVGHPGNKMGRFGRLWDPHIQK